MTFQGLFYFFYSKANIFFFLFSSLFQPTESAERRWYVGFNHLMYIIITLKHIHRMLIQISTLLHFGWCAYRAKAGLGKHITSCPTVSLDWMWTLFLLLLLIFAIHNQHTLSHCTIKLTRVCTAQSRSVCTKHKVKQITVVGNQTHGVNGWWFLTYSLILDAVYDSIFKDM